MDKLTDAEVFAYMEMLLNVLQPLWSKTMGELEASVAEELIQPGSALSELVSINERINSLPSPTRFVVRKTFDSDFPGSLDINTLNMFIDKSVYGANHYIAKAFNRLQTLLPNVKTVIKSSWALEMLSVLPRLDLFSKNDAARYLRLTLMVIKEISELREDYTLDIFIGSYLLQLLAENRLISIAASTRLSKLTVSILCSLMQYRTNSEYTITLRNAFNLSLSRNGDDVSDVILKLALDLVIGLETNTDIKDADDVRVGTGQFFKNLMESIEEMHSLVLEPVFDVKASMLRKVFLFIQWNGNSIDLKDKNFVKEFYDKLNEKMH